MPDVGGLRRTALENRKKVLAMLFESQSGHPGGSLSVIDMITALYELKVDFSKKERSRVILSKGHAVPAVYAELHTKGIICDDEMHTLRKFGSRLQGHPSVLKIPELDASTGLLGQGLSIGVGMALAKKIHGDPHKVYVVCGDGEMMEGQIYEALTQAAFYQLDNLVLIIDHNHLCLSGPIRDVMDLGDIGAKLASFGWQVLGIDGHDMEQIAGALEQVDAPHGGPIAIIGDTIKGKGVSFMENQADWHGGVMTARQYALALAELDTEREAFNV